MSRSFSNLMDDDYDEVLEQYEGNAPDMVESEKYKNIPEMGKIEEGEEEEEEEEEQQDGSLATEEADENDMHLLLCEETISCTPRKKCASWHRLPCMYEGIRLARRKEA